MSGYVTSVGTVTRCLDLHHTGAACDREHGHEGPHTHTSWDGTRAWGVPYGDDMLPPAWFRTDRS